MKKNIKYICASVSGVAAIGMALLTGCSGILEPNKVQNVWTPLQTMEEDGLLGERVDLWRQVRLPLIDDSGYLIDGFEHRPGSHAWQGEHLGKWLHAATLAYLETKDPALKARMDENVNRLLATQLEDGYLGTYDEYNRITNAPQNDMFLDLADDIEAPAGNDSQAAAPKTVNRSAGGWDIWTLRYNLYGLLFYERHFPNEEIVEACRKVGDLLIRVYGDGQYDLTQYGTRYGISSMTVLESIVMLYQRTGEKKYLDFAETLVEQSEANPRLRLMGTMLEKGSVVYPGQGKGYQLMSNLLGYLQLYRCTEDERYLQTVLNAWEDIYQHHLLTTGGPWSRHMDYNGNQECFAFTDAFHPRKVLVEGCCDATWLQLNTHLFELTGDAKYAAEAEKSLINSIFAHQLANGASWFYFVKANDCNSYFQDGFKCCGSSEPRALEIYAHNLVGKYENRLSINSLAPSEVALSEEFGGGRLVIESQFPKGQQAEFNLGLAESRSFVLEFRLPVQTALKKVTVNGEEVNSLQNGRGFFEIERQWEKGDVVSVDYEYQLGFTLQDGEEGRHWIAFTYGPIALSQKILNYPSSEPLKDKAMGAQLNVSGDAIEAALHHLLEAVPGEDDHFHIKDTDVELIPYWETFGSHPETPWVYLQESHLQGGGPFTYFEI